MADQKKTKIVIEVEKCVGCPFHFTTPYPTNDSWERPEYYWCKHPGYENKGRDEEDETTRVNIKKGRKLESLSYVAGYVEWMDKTPVPEWCPIKVED